MRLSKVVIGLLVLLLQAAAVYADNNDMLLSNRSEAAGQSVKYSARNTINAGPAYTVESGASVAMRAGSTITLLPGFLAKAGSNVAMGIGWQDSAAPTITSQYPLNQATVSTQGRALAILVVFGDDNSGIYSRKLLDANRADISSQAIWTDNSVELILNQPCQQGNVYWLIIEDFAGNIKEQKIEFFPDCIAPQTTVSTSGGQMTLPINVDLSATDDKPGTITIHYSTDGYPPEIGASNTTSATSPINSIVINKTTRLQFFAVDQAGNREKAKSEIYVFDELPAPVTGLTATYDTNSGGVALSWTAAAAANGYRVYRCLNAMECSILTESKTGEYPPPRQFRIGPAGPVVSTSYIDTAVSQGLPYKYAVSVVTTGNVEGAISTLVTAQVPELTNPANSTDAVNRAIAWLQAHQHEDGYWGEKESSRMLATSQALNALAGAVSVESNAALRQGLFYLRGRHADNNDFLARKIITLNSFGQNVDEFVTRLISQAYWTKSNNVDVVDGWGQQRGFDIDPVDTALAAIALTKADQIISIEQAYSNLQNSARQASVEGLRRFGWLPGGATSIYPTSLAYYALNKHFYPTGWGYVFDPQWMLAEQKTDGSFRNNVTDTAAVVRWPKFDT